MPDAPSDPPKQTAAAASGAGSPTARLLNADVITDTRAALATFEDEARSVIESVGMKSEATLRWLDEEAPRYWVTSARQANEATAAARSALEICRQRTVAGHRSTCLEEKQALRRAKDREEFCRDQRTMTRSTSTSLRQTVDELRTRIVQLERWLDGELPRLQARLHQTSVAVSAYTATRPAAVRPVSRDEPTSPAPMNSTPTSSRPTDSTPTTEPKANS